MFRTALLEREHKSACIVYEVRHTNVYPISDGDSSINGMTCVTSVHLPEYDWQATGLLEEVGRSADGWSRQVRKRRIDGHNLQRVMPDTSAILPLRISVWAQI